MPADAVLPCGPRRSSPHIPAGSFCAAAHGNATDAAPRGTDAAARNASYTRAQRIDVDAAKRARGHAAGGSGCSSNAAGDGGTGWPANGLSAVPTGISISADAATGVWPAVPAAVPAGYQQPYQQMPQQQYNPWAQQMTPQPYQQWPQSFQQQMPPMQSSQQPAAQMMYPNAANQYAQPQPDVFVSDRGNAALGYLAQNQACGATDLARAFGNSAPTWSRTLNDLAQAGLVIKHGQKYHLTELGAARVRAQS